jgi:hypothetical protein
MDTSDTSNPNPANLESSATVDARRVIDNEIEDLYERIRARKLDRNDLAPISKIPVELLSYIFSLVQRKCRHDSREDLGWVVVTHICQRWRNIALDNPTLWVYVPSHRPKWIPEMTRRSKSATLKINLNAQSFTPSRFSTLRTFLAAHLPRVRSITVYPPLPPDRLIQKLLQDIPARSAQCLEHFNLQDPLGYPHTFNPMLFVEKVLIDPPCLKKLKMYGTIDWNSKILTSLTHFIVHYGNLMATESPPHSEFLDALTRMPALRILHLHHVPLPAPTEELPSKLSNIVRLSQLQSILLSGSASTVCNILRHISPSEGARIQLTLEISVATDVAAVAALFRGRYTSADVAIKWPLARCLEFSMEAGHARMTAWSHSQHTILHGALPDHDSFLGLKLCSNLLGSAQQEIVSRAVLEICSASPFRTLTALSLFSGVEWAGFNAEFLAEALGRQPEVQSVRVEGPALKAFLGFMAAGAHKGISSKATVNLPSLRYLAICSARFKESWLSVQVLQDILRQRKQSGMKLSQVDFKWCSYLFTSDIDIIEENAHTVTWDKIFFRDSCNSSTSEADFDEDSSSSLFG